MSVQFVIRVVAILSILNAVTQYARIALGRGIDTMIPVQFVDKS